jgi:predicted helicase
MRGSHAHGRIRHRAMPSSDKWKNFERLVAAVHRAADEGADVRWNDSIQGRQFDVTIRFRKGLYDYLTVVECKSYDRPVSVEKVDAFVTKATDVHANCAVIASTSGFQSGAQEVAQRHNVTLIEVTESSDIDFSVFGARVVGVTKTLHIQSVELLYTDGERKKLPEESHKLT